jgi:hypothetical protein
MKITNAYIYQMTKKSSRLFLKLGSFGKSNSAKSNKEEKIKKTDKSRLPSPSTGGWDFTMVRIYQKASTTFFIKKFYINT